MNNGVISNGLQVAYERVNLADIETSSDEDDYGDLFAHVSHNIFDHARNVKSQNMFIFIPWNWICNFVFVNSSLEYQFTGNFRSGGWVMGKVVLSEICPRKKVSDYSRYHRALFPE